MGFQIEKVAVIGAGTMGGGIAAHLANIGIPVILLDIVTPGLSEEEAENPAARNRLVQSLYDRMVKARPANLARRDRADLISIGNIDDDLGLVADCDWVVEVIIERLEPKKELMARLEKLVKPTAIISSNTSGIPIHRIVEDSSESFKQRFLGTHFFNPPRYLKLLEIIPTPDTDPELLQFMVEFGRKQLGKGVVVCKDTPNFIANRFIAISGSYAVEKAMQEGYTVAEIDALTGPLIGRPKTGTFRLTDLVGLDVMIHVNRNLYPLISDDKYKDVLLGEKSNALYDKMVENKWLGNKTGVGFYKKETVDGARQFWTLDLNSFEHRNEGKIRFDSVGAVRNIEDLGARLKALLELDDRAAAYIRDTLYFNLAYAAYISPEIAYNVADIDNANKWGFAHDVGPFEIWDMLGVAETVKKMEAAGHKVADWVKEMLAKGNSSFYKEDGSYYTFDQNKFIAPTIDKDIVYVADLYKNGKEVERNDSGSLLDMGDGVMLFEFHSKLNSIDTEIIELGNSALARLADFDGMVIGNNGSDFCIGANLGLLGIAAAQGMWDQIEQIIKSGQQLTFDLRHASKPVVTAPHQRVLGGGVEFTMAGWASVADHETYMGLVEVGVGLLPAWGGCKELLRRRVNPVMSNPNGDIVPVMQDVFEQVATAKVGTSAWENKALGYLREDDQIVMGSDYRLSAAKKKVLALVASGARPPEVEKVYAAGRNVLSALKLGVKSFNWAGYATDHDLKIGLKVAHVLCGGELSAPAWVDPWYILDLEREAFLSLLSEKLTQERIMHMLQTGKPLRN